MDELQKAIDIGIQARGGLRPTKLELAHQKSLEAIVEAGRVLGKNLAPGKEEGTSVMRKPSGSCDGEQRNVAEKGFPEHADGGVADSSFNPHNDDLSNAGDVESHLHHQDGPKNTLNNTRDDATTGKGSKDGDEGRASSGSNSFVSAQTASNHPRESTIAPSSAPVV